MLGNSEKMVVIPPTNNQSPQSQIIDEQKVSIGSSGRIMEKPGQELLQQQQQSLKCPRCDSSNTKFCYYNNYSLSQPRHFCKACKRYWTRGGTLRNVPVGGGCRKNKRVKRPTSSAIDTSSSAPIPSANTSLPSQPQIDIHPLFYGLTSNSCDMNLPFARFNSRVSRVETVSGYDLQPQLNALGLGFSSGIMSSEAGDNGYPNGYTSNNSLLSSYSSIFGRSSSSSASNSPIMASLLQQQKFINGGLKDGPATNSTFQGLAPLEELQIAGNNGRSEAEMVALKEVKVEERQRRLEWNNIGACQNQIEHGGGLSDYAPYYWNAAAATTTAMGAWNDQTNNVGPSVTSLI